MPYLPPCNDDGRAPTQAARAALALLSAALYAAAYPPMDVRWSATVALAPLFVALRDTTARQALGLGLLWSLAAMNCGITDWLVSAVSRYYDQPWYVGASGCWPARRWWAQAPSTAW